MGDRSVGCRSAEHDVERHVAECDDVVVERHADDVVNGRAGVVVFVVVGPGERERQSESVDECSE
jgi:hypothetical protein